MNPLDLTYCETHSWLHMAQPWNTISNALFFIVALVLWQEVRKTPAGQDKPLIWLIASIVLVGACSWFWHATQYSWGLIVDIVGILIFTTYYIYYVGLKRLGVSFAQSSLALVAILGLCVVAMKLTDALMPQRSGAFIPLSLLFFGVTGKLWSTSKILALYFMGAGVAMALAIVARIIDLSVCDHMYMGTHFLWHSLTALTTYCLIIPVIRSHPSR